MRWTSLKYLQTADFLGLSSTVIPGIYSLILSVPNVLGCKISLGSISSFLLLLFNFYEVFMEPRSPEHIKLIFCIYFWEKLQVVEEDSSNSTAYLTILLYSPFFLMATSSRIGNYFTEFQIASTANIIEFNCILLMRSGPVPKTLFTCLHKLDLVWFFSGTTCSSVWDSTPRCTATATAVVEGECYAIHLPPQMLWQIDI